MADSNLMPNKCPHLAGNNAFDNLSAPMSDVEAVIINFVSLPSLKIDKHRRHDGMHTIVQFDIANPALGDLGCILVSAKTLRATRVEFFPVTEPRSLTEEIKREWHHSGRAANQDYADRLPHWQEGVQRIIEQFSPHIPLHVRLLGGDEPVSMVPRHGGPNAHDAMRLAINTEVELWAEAADAEFDRLAGECQAALGAKFGGKWAVQEMQPSKPEHSFTNLSPSLACAIVRLVLYSIDTQGSTHNTMALTTGTKSSPADGGTRFIFCLHEGTARRAFFRDRNLSAEPKAFPSDDTGTAFIFVGSSEAQGSYIELQPFTNKPIMRARIEGRTDGAMRPATTEETRIWHNWRHEVWSDIVNKVIAALDDTQRILDPFFTPKKNQIIPPEADFAVLVDLLTHLPSTQIDSHKVADMRATFYKRAALFPVTVIATLFKRNPVQLVIEATPTHQGIEPNILAQFCEIEKRRMARLIADVVAKEWPNGWVEYAEEELRKMRGEPAPAKNNLKDYSAVRLGHGDEYWLRYKMAGDVAMVTDLVLTYADKKRLVLEVDEPGIWRVRHKAKSGMPVLLGWLQIIDLEGYDVEIAFGSPIHGNYELMVPWIYELVSSYPDRMSLEQQGKPQSLLDLEVHQQQQQAAKAAPQRMTNRAKPGRKTTRFYVEAFEKIEHRGMTLADAYQEFLAAAEIKVSSPDTRRAFEAAMRRLRRKAQNASD